MLKKFINSLQLSDLNGTNGFSIRGASPKDQSGHAVASVGDLNGDGISDLIIGAPSADPRGRPGAGVSYVIFGSQTEFSPTLELFTLNGKNGFSIQGVSTYGNSGISVAHAGDINGDGVSDLIIGAPSSGPDGQPYSGASYVVFGSHLEFRPILDLAALNGANGFSIHGASIDDHSGASVGGGDINGDGISDLIIGAPLASPGGRAYAGASYVVFGSHLGFRSTLELSDLNGANGFSIHGVSANDNSGSSVANAGDINGDGISDLIIGAPLASPSGRSEAGESYVVFGSRAEFNATLELSNLNGTNGFSIPGISGSDQSGSSVANAGDVNGDGTSDFIIGAPLASPDGRSGAGASYVVFGSHVGFKPTLELHTLNGTNGFSIYGISTYGWSGRSVSNAGDINGDGASDLIIGAPAGLSRHSYAGASYVVFGSQTGVSPILKLSTLNGINGFSIQGVGVSKEDYSGYSVANAGDINGDGINDLIIGAPLASPGGRFEAGESYVIFGGPTFLGLPPTLSPTLLPTPPSTLSPTLLPTFFPTQSSANNNQANNTSLPGVVAGIIIVSIALIGTGLALVYRCCLKKRPAQNKALSNNRRDIHESIPLTVMPDSAMSLADEHKKSSHSPSSSVIQREGIVPSLLGVQQEFQEDSTNLQQEGVPSPSRVLQFDQPRRRSKDAQAQQMPINSASDTTTEHPKKTISSASKN